MITVLALALVVGSTIGLRAQQSGPTTNRATVTPVLERDTAHAGTTVRAALNVTVPPGLHVQADRPRDPSLIPAVLTTSAPTGVTDSLRVFPPTTDIVVPGIPERQPVFEGSFVVGVEFALAPDLPPGPITIPARFRYQACNENSCFPPVTLNTSWTFTVVPRTQALGARKGDPFRTIQWSRGYKPAAAPAPSVTTAAPPSAVSAGTAAEALALFDEFTIRGTSGGYVKPAPFLEFIHNAEAGITAKGMFDGRGPLAIIALVFLGGLALNLTPCVLPMIPINLGIIGAGAHGAKRGRGFLLGAVYGAAMALVYGVLGLIVILTAGTFGTINASPWFNIAIAVLFVVLALAMFDIIPLDPSRLSSGIQFNQASRGSVLLAFGMGAVAALLAGACVAPVVIQVVVFASQMYATGTKAALALPFVLGLGMALPWPLAGAGLGFLPKPGMWMVRVKQAFGVFILATAVYYGYLAYELISSRWVDPATVKASVEEQLKAGWHASLVEGLTIAKRDRTPVFIDFWATWCKNCLVLDKTTLADPAVTAALSGYTRIKFQAEDAEVSPARELLQRINAVGLPAYVVLQPK